MTQEWTETYGPWAIVTGASSGIGKAMTIELANRGLNLVLVARRRHLLEELAESLAAETRVVAADLATLDGVERVHEVTADLDVGLLVANAGFGTAGTFLELPIDRELMMLNVNCRAVTQMAHHYGRRLVARQRGGLILIGSIVGFQGVPNSTHYAATKAYVQSLGEGLHRELAAHGVDVLTSAPAPINTEFAQQANMELGMALDAQTVARATLNALGRKATVRPGFLSKLLIGLLDFLPRWVRVLLMEQIMGGMVKEHEAAHA